MKQGADGIKQQSYFRHVLKITTDQLAAAGWDLHIDIHEAKLTGTMISLAESTCIRMIEDIAGVDRAANMQTLRDSKRRIRELRKEPKSREQTKAIKEAYRQQDEVQFLPEYLCVVSATKAAFRRACRGFTVNGMKFHRLVGTTGGVKNSTVVFAAERARNGAELIQELRRRIDNGRDMTKEFVPAKLEAYRALVCSASAPLSDPRGVLVVDDCVTKFKASYILLEDGETDEPKMSTVVDGEVEANASDGFGLMSPGLALRWSRDLKLDYRPAGVCIRNSFCKGMVFTFDFHEFASDIAGNYEVKDIWGDTHDIRDIDLVLTASMLKLWDSYTSWDDYWNKSISNGYCFGATKATPDRLDVERRTNYQFLQSYHLTDEQLWELVEPTLTELTEVSGGDYAKTLLFLRGKHVTEETAWSTDLMWVSALSIDKRMINDPYVINQLKKLVKRRVAESKFGKLKVSGNFSIISGDPYSLCQSIWSLPVKGLLKPGELYNRYWLDKKTKEVACFRAPMSSHHNIRRMSLNASWNASHWYQYMSTVTILNSWDMTTHALNGADFDGDMFFLSDNHILVNNIRDLLPIQCEQKKASKCVPGEKEFCLANERGFGDEIGSVTNRITAQTEIQSLFPADSQEYKELAYRIVCGQKIQQDVIDSLKGIIAKPMPKHWYNAVAAEASDDPIDVSICADKKPYFMIYRYSDLHSQYKAFSTGVSRKCKIMYGMSFDDLVAKDNKTDEEHNYVMWVNRLCPVKIGHGVMNRICKICEEYFKKQKGPKRDKAFDYSILKSGCEYSRYTKDKIAALYREYTDCFQKIKDNSTSDQDFGMKKMLLGEEFKSSCASICPNPLELCDIIVDLCYKTEKSKQFAWDVCGNEIIHNLLVRNGGMVHYYQATKHGEILYCGERFTEKTLCVMDVENEGNYIEREDQGGGFNKFWRNFK